jgi:hypothetical protein
MRAFRDQLDAIERQEQDSERMYHEMRHSIEGQIEQERNDADATGLRASAAALVDNRGQLAGLMGSFDTVPTYTYAVRVLRGSAPSVTLEAQASSQDEARERLIARVIAHWQGAT